ncbi:MAG: hypothetical protein ACRDSZ_06030 [Pseudonocardiaceae bacterium]
MAQQYYGNELAPSNAWRADELTAAVTGYRGVPEVERTSRVWRRLTGRPGVSTLHVARLAIDFVARPGLR